MRLINDIILHCTANPVTSKITLEDIRRDHINNKHYRDIGYHYVIFQDGSVERGRPISQAGAHCYGHNAHSIGIAYVGGIDAHGRPVDTRTDAQRGALVKLIYNLIKMYRCDVHGHHDYNQAKDCPCFDAHKEYTSMYQRIIQEGH